MRLMKVFCPHYDTPKMPENVKEAFFDIACEKLESANDAYIPWQIGGTYFVNMNDELKDKIRIVDDYLISQGCTPNLGNSPGELVLIKYWW